MISVLGTIQSRTLMLVKSSAFWNILSSGLISSSLVEFSILLWMKWSKSTLVKAFSLASLLILVPVRSNRTPDMPDANLLIG